jgi:hypothetical protein
MGKRTRSFGGCHRFKSLVGYNLIGQHCVGVRVARLDEIVLLENVERIVFVGYGHDYFLARPVGRGSFKRVDNKVQSIGGTVAGRILESRSLL